MHEQSPSPEFSEEEVRLIKIFKENGPQDEEGRELLNQWLDREEEGATSSNTSRANIELNLKRAKLYSAAGLQEAARENAEDAMAQAANEGEPELWDRAQAILQSLK